MKSPDRAEHVGSLLRPPELLQARAAFSEGRLNQEQLREVEDRSVLDALQQQDAIGLDRITDGEFRRGSWLTDMADAVEGFVRDRVVLDWKGPGGGPEESSANAVGAKLHKTRHLTAHEVLFLVQSSIAEKLLPRVSSGNQASLRRHRILRDLQPGERNPGRRSRHTH